jgi:glucose/arabinose dehydrogenase
MTTWSEVLRYPFVDAQGTPRAMPDSVLVGLPRSGHAARSIVLDHSGRMLVNIGAPTNSCQTYDKVLGAPGRDPCPELQNFAGIWRFDPRRRGQRQSDGVRVATGVRHVVALAVHPESGIAYGVQHGRDDLYESFPSLYDRAQGEQLPAEEMFALDSARDYGWPYCYYDAAQRRKVLAPEYGGDGMRVGRCASAALPMFAFPSHWAPNGLHFYRGAMFPSRYRGGAFVAFHGGWYRSPPDNGFNVVFLPFDGTRPASRFEVFADGFAGRDRHPARARHRPVGIAEAADGALFITDDRGGRIWRVIYAPPVR